MYMYTLFYMRVKYGSISTVSSHLRIVTFFRIGTDIFSFYFSYHACAFPDDYYSIKWCVVCVHRIQLKCIYNYQKP